MVRSLARTYQGQLRHSRSKPLMQMDDEYLQKVRLKVQIGITAILGLFSIYLIAHEPSESASVKWAIGTLGIIIGYWLK